MSEERVLSHIQIPKTILKEFADEKNSIFYYDFADAKVKRGRAKYLYTQYGYYSKKMEEWLSGEVETGLGKLVESMRNTNFTCPQDLPIHYEEISFKYLFSLISRSPNMIEEMNRDSFYFQLFDSTNQHDIAAHDCYNIAIENNFLSTYHLDIVNNLTTVPFILASGGTCTMKAGILCPITPSSALLFSQKEYEGDYIRLHEVSECADIDRINIITYEQEKRTNRRYLFSNSKQVIENMIGCVGRSIQQ